MAIKKSELYSSLWSSCDELRGGMDASQYKDYVLVMLFIKYVSDKYADVPYAPITVPKGASFKDMVALKGKPDIGDQINKKIIAPLADANKHVRHAGLQRSWQVGQRASAPVTSILPWISKPSSPPSTNMPSLPISSSA